jgi:ATP-binding protein involved in chromosome partitioning
MKFILGIAAGKGGVGKSCLTVNVALCLQRMGKSVGIIDADIYGPSVRKMLPEDVPLRHSESSPNRLVPAERDGIQFISASFFLKDEEAAIVRAPIANGLVKQFFHSVDWGELDCLLVDFPPGTGDIPLTLMQEMSFSGGVVITTPQEVALQDVSKAISLFHRMRVPVLGLVENMSYFQDPLSPQRYYPFGNGGGRRLCLKEGIPFLGEIPIEGEISRCCDAGVSLWESEAKMSISAFESIAQKIWEQLLAFERMEGNYLKNFKLLWN